MRVKSTFPGSSAVAHLSSRTVVSRIFHLSHCIYEDFLGDKLKRNQLGQPGKLDPAAQTLSLYLHFARYVPGLQACPGRSHSDQPTEADWAGPGAGGMGQLSPSARPGKR